MAEESVADCKNGVFVVTSISDIPDHILIDIFANLSAKSACRCRSVCKTWYAFLVSPNFISLHFDRSPMCPIFRTNNPSPPPPPQRSIVYGSHSLQLYVFEEEEEDWRRVRFNLVPRIPGSEIEERGYDIVNSCNGFLCLHVSFTNYPVAVYNPVTGEYSLLPADVYINSRYARLKVLGLGYCARTDRYKVLLVKLARRKAKAVWLYKLGPGGGWRKLKTKLCRRWHMTCLGIPVFLNGALHWRVRGANNTKGGILSFDLEQETFRVLPIPLDRIIDVGAIENRTWPILTSLGLLRGHLCLSFENPSRYIEFWVMKKYGDAESWIKVYEYNGFARGRSPLWLCQEPGIIRSLELLTHSPLLNYLYLIDEENVIRHLRNDEHGDFECGIFAYVPSLSSLKAITGNSLQVLNVRLT